MYSYKIRKTEWVLEFMQSCTVYIFFVVGPFCLIRLSTALGLYVMSYILAPNPCWLSFAITYVYGLRIILCY